MCSRSSRGCARLTCSSPSTTCCTSIVGQAPLEAYLRLLLEVPALEVRNGAMLASHNALIERYARTVQPGWVAIGGSDAHTLRRVGTTWTEVPDAASAAGFLAGLRAGTCAPGGVNGSVLAISGDVYGVVARYIASLAGIGPSDHHGLERLACLAFSAGSLPFQFTPALVAVVEQDQRTAEGRRGARPAGAAAIPRDDRPQRRAGRLSAIT